MNPLGILLSLMALLAAGGILLVLVLYEWPLGTLLGALGLILAMRFCGLM